MTAAKGKVILEEHGPGYISVKDRYKHFREWERYVSLCVSS